MNWLKFPNLLNIKKFIIKKEQIHVPNLYKIDQTFGPIFNTRKANPSLHDTADT